MTLETYIALNRFAMGPKAGDRMLIASDPRGWLLSQISRNQPKYSYNLPASQQVVMDYLALKNIKGKESNKETLRSLRDDVRNTIFASIGARFDLSASDEAPLRERMVLFWSNVFTVSAGQKKNLLPLFVAYERDAIRPHIFGQFEDLLIAATMHPGMLVYLNNAISVGPNSRIGKNRDKGLNENLARETLELHSLGVHGGYTQADVISLAKIITGWTIANDRVQRLGQRSSDVHTDAYGFAFVPQMHEPGAKTLLGKVYDEDGIEQGLSALRDLARHPSTAHYMAMRLVTHFIGDEPPRDSIDKIARVFLDTQGNLAEVTAALIKIPEAWSFLTPKVKSPYELLVSQVRALNIGRGDKAGQISHQNIVQALYDMGQIPFSANSPAGWTDHTIDWASASGMMKRIEWAQALARRVSYDSHVADLASDLFGEGLQATTLQAIKRAPTQVDAMTLLLTSPEMQKR